MTAAAALMEARRRLAAGDVAGARKQGERLLRGAAGDGERADAHLLLAACAQRANDLAGATHHVRAALGLQPRDARAYYLQAEIQESSGDPRGAMASIARSVEFDPGFVQGWFYLGILRGEGGDPAGAAAAFERCVALDPRHARGWNNLGNALRSVGRIDEAERAFARAVEVKPDYGLAVANLAKLLRDTGEVERAEAVLREALARPTKEPPFRPLLVLLAGLLRERGLLDESAQLYLRAIQAAPQESAGEWFSLGWVLTERGDPDRARDAYSRAYKLNARDLRSLCGLHLTLPMVYGSREALEDTRERYARGLQSLVVALPAAARGLAPAAVIDGLRWTNFFLAYQGRDDRDLQERYADIVAATLASAAPEWRVPIAPRAPRDRIRVGFASAFFHTGTAGRYFRSWIIELPRDRFEVYVYHLWPGMDEIAEEIHGRADVFRTFGGSDARPSVVAPVIRDDALDVLVYPELGMDVTSFALAALRLAPRQLAGWGHPVTTGHATIDAFVSCELMEPPGAVSQYTEELLLLPGIGTSYRRPAVPEDSDRTALGLPTDRPLLLCPQSLFKIHPDNDDLFAEILIANPEAKIVFFSGRHPAITDQFMRRLEASLARRGLAVRERTIVLPQLPHLDYLRVNLACDAMIDTLHWSGGNTSLDALACGTPVVTLPGASMRGRQSAAMLGLLGVEELVARDREDYVAIASRLLRDTAWRATMAERIRLSQHELFDRRDALLRWQEILVAQAKLARGQP